MQSLFGKRTRAYQILDIEPGTTLNKRQLKRQYTKLCLKYHPDKNTSPDACARFQKINESYTYLNDHLSGETGTVEDEKDSGGRPEEAHVNMKTWQGIFSHDFTHVMSYLRLDSNMYETLIQSITESYETRAMQFIETMDKETLMQIYVFLCNNRTKFPVVTDSLIDYMDELLKNTLTKKLENDRRVILYPSLSDLFACNVYKLVEGGETYLIPLWMDELVYDLVLADSAEPSELIVHCVPVLPENTYMDENNHIHQKVVWNLSDIWTGGVDISVTLGGQTFVVKLNQLRLQREQVVVFARQGIPKPNLSEIFDVSHKGNVYIHVYLV